MRCCRARSLHLFVKRAPVRPSALVVGGAPPEGEQAACWLALRHEPSVAPERTWHDQATLPTRAIDDFGPISLGEFDSAHWLARCVSASSCVSPTSTTERSGLSCCQGGRSRRSSGGRGLHCGSDRIRDWRACRVKTLSDSARFCEKCAELRRFSLRLTRDHFIESGVWNPV